MSDHDRGPFLSDSANRNTLLAGGRKFNSAPREVTHTSVDDYGTFVPAEHDQIERDIAEIVRATAALRKAQPALESWTEPPAMIVGKARPVWVLIAVLWISTALVTVGAVVTIAALIG